MLFWEILLVILAAFVIGSLFYYLLRLSGPWGSFWSFILILILAGLAAAAWISPVGPVYYDIAWFPVLFTILLFAILMAAATPSRRERSRTTATQRSVEDTEGGLAFVALSAFFWIFLLFLLIAAVWGILR
ncbi:MAG: hypothetical protein R6U64_07845 [Bacteroidales bacterium]